MWPAAKKEMKIAIPLPVFAAQSNLHFPGNYLQPLDINADGVILPQYNQ